MGWEPKGRVWVLWRQDDQGNRFAVEGFADKEKALARMRDFESRGHKQTYWIEQQAPE